MQTWKSVLVASGTKAALRRPPMRRLLLTQDMARTEEQFSRPEIGVVNTQQRELIWFFRTIATVASERPR